MNIEGLSEGTLEKLIGWGVLHDRLDIYKLDKHRDEILMMDGFGKSLIKISGRPSNAAESPPLSGI